MLPFQCSAVLLPFQIDRDARTEQKNAVSCEYSVRVITKENLSFAFDCRCHMGTPPPCTSVFEDCSVLPVLHAAGVMFHFHKFSHVFQRKAKQWFSLLSLNYDMRL